MPGQAGAFAGTHTRTASQYALLSLQAVDSNHKEVATRLFTNLPQLTKQQPALGSFKENSGPRTWQGGRRTLIFKGIKVPSGFSLERRC